MSDCAPCVSFPPTGYEGGYGPPGDPGDPGVDATGGQPSFPSGATVTSDGWCQIGDPGSGIWGPNFAAASGYGLAYRREGDRMAFRGAAQIVRLSANNNGPIKQQMLCAWPNPNGINDVFFGKPIGLAARYKIPAIVSTYPPFYPPEFAASVPCLTWTEGGAGGLCVAFISPLGIQLFYDPPTAIGTYFRLAVSHVPMS